MKIPHRLFTRTLLACTFAFVGVASWHCLDWLYSLDPEKLSDVQYAASVAVPAALIGALLKFAGEMYSRYMDTGRQMKRDVMNGGEQ